MKRFNDKTPQGLEQKIFNKYYLREYEMHDGEKFTTFTIYDLNVYNKQITVAISSLGRLSTITFDLHKDRLGVYFEFGYYVPRRIYVADFA